VLALAGIGTSVLIQRLGLCLKKEPLPLRKPLGELNEKQLAPYKVTARLPMENREILESLGTEDYLQWVLEDPRESAQSPVQKLLLFVTYYRQPDRVPHVPEECYTGGGYRRLATDAIEFRIGGTADRRDVARASCPCSFPSPDNRSKGGTPSPRVPPAQPFAGQRDIPGRYLLFEKAAAKVAPGLPQFPVLYLFRVNGEYAGSRDEARMALNKNLFHKHSYFCKIELVFNQSLTVPAQDDAVAAGEKLLAVLLPLLEREHWPDGT
jgi:hypothetical protein